MFRTKFILASVLLLLLILPCASALPTETTRLIVATLYENFPDFELAKFENDDEIQYIPVKTLTMLIVGANLDNFYAPDIEDAETVTRIHVEIVSSENNVVFDDYLDWRSTGSWFDPKCWRIYYEKENLDILLSASYYDIIITYSVFNGISWNNADVWIDRVSTEPPPDVPDIPDIPPSDVSDFLPFMLSLGVISGMAFIGYNLTKTHDPTPAFFMLFCGVYLTWSIDWLPTWIFITTIALLSIMSAAMWGKIFRRGGG